MNEAYDFRFRVAGVLKSSYFVLIRNILPFGVITVVMLALFHVSTIIFGEFYWNYTLQNLPVQRHLDHELGFSMLRVVILDVLYAVPFSILAAALISGSMLRLRGLEASFKLCIRQGLATMPRSFGVVLVATLVISVPGLILAIFDFVGTSPLTSTVPYLYVAICLVTVKLVLLCPIWLAVPVTVIEGRGVFKSLGRSMRLTKGDRVRMFALVVLIWETPNIVNSLINMIDTTAQNLEVSVAIGTLKFLVEILCTAFEAVAMAVGYDTIRRAKEGVGADEIAKVFD